MKFTAAALLALSVAAVTLKQDDAADTQDDAAVTQEDVADYGPVPDCGPVPEFPEGTTDKDIFLMIAGEDQMIDPQEAHDALYCAAVWELLDIDDAMFAYEEGLLAAGGDGKLSLQDAGLA